MSSTQRSSARSRSIAALVGLLVALGAHLVTAAPASAEEACTDWVNVPHGGLADQYINDRTMFVVIQTQSCSDGSGQQQYIRSWVHQTAEQTWTKYPVRDMTVRIKTSDNSTTLYMKSMPQPGVGKTFFTPRFPIAPNSYDGQVFLNYVGAPQGYFQYGSTTWTHA